MNKAKPAPTKLEGGKRILHPSSSPPLFSVITAIRNNKETIQRTVESILNQTLKSVEHIIVDGASTDGTIEILKKFNNQVEYWISEPDESATHGFNKGFDLSRGKYIIFVNGDDWLIPNYLELALKSLESSNADFVFGNATFYEGNNALYIRKGIPDYEKLIYYHGCPFIVTTSFRRSSFEKVGFFDVKYKHSPDYDLFLRLHLNGAKGIYDPNLMVNFSLGGNTYKNTVPSMVEVCKSSIKHGGSKFLAFFYLGNKVLSWHAKLILQKILPSDLYQKLHKFFRSKSPTIFIDSPPKNEL